VENHPASSPPMSEAGKEWLAAQNDVEKLLRMVQEIFLHLQWMILREIFTITLAGVFAKSLTKLFTI